MSRSDLDFFLAGSSSGTRAELFAACMVGFCLSYEVRKARSRSPKKTSTRRYFKDLRRPKKLRRTSLETRDQAANSKFGMIPGKAYPLLVAKAGRTAENTLDLAIAAANAQHDKLFFSAKFKPTTGNGPYYADANFEEMLTRIQMTRPDDRRWATIFRAGVPCYLHVDIDDSRPERPPVSMILNSFVKHMTEFMTNEVKLDAPLTEVDWYVDTCDSPKKTSLHLHALRLPFEDVSHCTALMARFKYYLEYKKALCWQDDDGKFRHVVDYSIYHANALLKLSFQHKPGKPAMLPRFYAGMRADDRSYEAIRKYLAAGMAHLPVHYTLKKADLLRISMAPTPSKPIPIPQARNLLVRPQATPLQLAAMPLIQQTVRDLHPGTKCEVTFGGKFPNTNKTAYYVKYDDVHKCAHGKTHDSNNARVLVGTTKAQYFCFAEGCSGIPFNLPDLPFAIAEPMPIKPRIPPRVIPRPSKARRIRDMSKFISSEAVCKDTKDDDDAYDSGDESPTMGGFINDDDDIGSQGSPPPDPDSDIDIMTIDSDSDRSPQRASGKSTTLTRATPTFCF